MANFLESMVGILEDYCKVTGLELDPEKSGVTYGWEAAEYDELYFFGFKDSSATVEFTYHMHDQIDNSGCHRFCIDDFAESDVLYDGDLEAYSFEELCKECKVDTTVNHEVKKIKADAISQLMDEAEASNDSADPTQYTVSLKEFY